MLWMRLRRHTGARAAHGKPSLLRHRSLRVAIPGLLAVVVVATLATSFVGGRSPISHATNIRTDLILLHGFDGGGQVNCNNNWSNVVDYLTNSGAYVGANHSWSPTGSIVALNYYSGDTTCSLPQGIPTDTLYHYTEAGTYGTEGGCQNVGRPDNLNGYEGTNNEDIQRLGCKLDWYIYNNYTKFGLPVMILAHSMGGLIARWGVGYDQQDSRYPGALWVPAIVTMGTPHQSAPSTGIFECGSCWEANEMIDDTSDPSNTMELLKPKQSPSADGHGTAWMTMAMSPNVPMVNYCYPPAGPCGPVQDCRPANVDGPYVYPDPIGQTMSGSERIEYLDPCYSHGAYLYNRAYCCAIPAGLPTTPPNDDNSDASANYCAPSCSMSATLTTATASFPKPLKAAYGFLIALVPAAPPTPTPTPVAGACLQHPSDTNCDNQDYIQQGCNHYPQSQTYSNSVVFIQLYYSTNCQSNWTWAQINASGYVLHQVWIEREATINEPALNYSDTVSSTTWYTNMVWAPQSPARSCATYKNTSTGVISSTYCTPWNPVSTSCKNAPNDANCDGQDYVVQGCNDYPQTSPAPVDNAYVKVTVHYSTNCESNWAVASLDGGGTLYTLVSVSIVRGGSSGSGCPPNCSAVNNNNLSTFWSPMVFAPSSPTKGCAEYANTQTDRVYTLCTGMA